jgi:hypothetical protein
MKEEHEMDKILSENDKIAKWIAENQGYQSYKKKLITLEEWEAKRKAEKYDAECPLNGIECPMCKKELRDCHPYPVYRRGKINIFCPGCDYKHERTL